MSSFSRGRLRIWESSCIFVRVEEIRNKKKQNILKNYFSLVSWLRSHTERSCFGFDLSSYPYMCVCVCVFSSVQLFAASCPVALQAPLPMEFSRQECWSELPFPSPGDLHNPGTEPLSLVSPALAGRFFTPAPSIGLKKSTT